MLRVAMGKGDLAVAVAKPDLKSSQSSQFASISWWIIADLMIVVIVL